MFKSKKGKNSFRTPYNGGNARVEGNGLKIPKLRKPISFRGSPLPKEYKLLSVTIELTKSGKWIASLCIETEVNELPKTGKQVGVDLGLTDLMILSDGTKIPAPKFGRKYQIKLAKEQRKLSKMRDRAKKEGRKPGSNYRKQQKKVARLCEKIANCRKDYVNKITKWLVENYDLIALEDVNVKGLQKNHKLAYSIADASWSSLVSRILYKAMWYGKKVIQIGRFQPTGTVCSECGALHTDIVNSLKVREWICPDCNTWHDRDVNAAINILNYALA